MSRFRILTAVAAVVAIVGVSAVFACDGAKTEQASAKAASCSSQKANVEQASAGKACCASKANVSQASAGAGCSAKQVASAGSCSASKASFASANSTELCSKSKASLAQMAPFTFLNDAKSEEVTVGISPTDNGFAFVFAGTNEANVVKAVALANNSSTMMGKPAACSMTRASMVETAGGCEYTEACLTALANCDITVVETEAGATTLVSGSSDEKVAELHTWLVSMGYGQADDSEGGE